MKTIQSFLRSKGLTSNFLNGTVSLVLGQGAVHPYHGVGSEKFHRVFCGIFSLEFVSNESYCNVVDVVNNYINNTKIKDRLSLIREEYLRNGEFFSYSFSRLEDERKFRELFQIPESVPRIWKTSCSTY